MQRTYEYRGFTLDVSVEADFKVSKPGHPVSAVGYVALVKILHGDDPITAITPLRLGDLAGRPFASDADALMGGYSAARKLVDDLFSGDAG
ncbi:MAG TPA: hypothetical protein VL689_09595 [Paraburkholderia sp.]|jgi:hypothetical protein|nr:hypothetical protein [Paraburkholderia sp.]